MNCRPLLAAFFLCFGTFVTSPAQETAPSTTAAVADLKILVDQIQTKLRAGQSSAADLASELAAFDALLAKYAAQRTDDVAQILYMQATLYGQVLNDSQKMKELFTRLKTDFPGSKPAAAADAALTAVARRAKAEAASASLVGKPAPQLHFKWASRVGLKTLADLKGNVVVLDFWATWCGPCVSSFPQVRELTAHYKDLAVVVLGVTSIQGSISGLQPQRIDTKGDPQKEMSLMGDYIKAKEITWTIGFSDEEVFNPDYGITGIPHMAIIAPDGTLRHTGLHPAMPHAEKIEKIDALLREFKLPVLATAVVP